MPLKKHVKLLKQRKKSLDSLATAGKKVTFFALHPIACLKLFCFCSQNLHIWLGGMFVPEAYITATRQFVAQANNWSLEELTLEVTSFFFSFLFFILCFLFFPSPHPPLFFIRFLLSSLLEKNSTKDSAVFIFSERWCSSCHVYCRPVYR